MEGAKADTLVHVPGAESLQGLQKVVGEGNGAVRGGMRVRLLARFGEKDHRTFPPKARGITEEETGHIAFLAIYRLERHNQYNRNTFLYQNC